MRLLHVYVLQAKDLPVKDTYVRVRVGKHKSQTSRTFKNNVSPVWNEEFVFRVRDNEEEELVVSVFGNDDENSGLFNGSGDLVGRVRIPVWSVAAERSLGLPPTWFSLEKPKTGKFVNVDRGKVLLAFSIHGKGRDSTTNHFLSLNPNGNGGQDKEFESSYMSSHGLYWSKAPHLKMGEGKKLMKIITSRLEKVFSKNDEGSRTDDSSESTASSSDYEDCLEEHPSSCSFEEAMEIMSSIDNKQDMPENLQGGILLDQTYVVSSCNLNASIFYPNSKFGKDLAELQGITDVEQGPWTWKSDMSSLARTVTYTKVAGKLVKTVKAIEDQTYIRADGREFAVFVNVRTPEVPYGNTFHVELLYKIVPGPDLSSGEKYSRLIISWAINFHQSTMMKGMIEGGVRQGLRESFDQLGSLLSQYFNILDSVESDLSKKDHVLATLEEEHQSDWELALEYFWNFTVISTIFMVLYVLIHILFCEPSKVQGLEFNGLDLPDSFGQLVTCAILVIQLERIYHMVSHFIQARLKRGCDHGIKAQGEGWVLTVALIEGTNLASLDATGLLDPYVLFTCNGKTRTSSVKLQSSDPQWNDILEFDAMEEPPSVLHVEVFDFDGPFDQATSLGHAEINFLKHTYTELADFWVSLQGKLAQSSQSKLHLRIFLDNNKGVETIKEYLTKMEREVGKKLNLRSPHKNSAFQKLFGLPLEEFLISDFTCQLKRKMPLQGRLFLSARIVGFYANFFGHKTKIFFLWEDIEDIHVLPPSLSSMGSPSLVIVMRKGKGLDAGHWAKSQDDEGRLRFYFQSFVSFNVASRTIMALWRTRTLSPEQKAQIAEEQQQYQEDRTIMLEDSGSILDARDVQMSKIYSSELPISTKSLMEIFDGGKMEHKVMENSGCLNYATTTWESVKPGVSERHLSYRFSRHVSIFGGEVTCTQQKSSIANDEGWVVNEIMVLHGVPFCDHFHINFRHRIEKSNLAHSACKCDVYIGITWLKSTKLQNRISGNINQKFAYRMREIFGLVEREILLAVQQDSSI